jgi:tRNA pseudouridine55 synthase
LIDGLLVIDKPVGWTSHDVVAFCRKWFGQKRIGHAGTLDPDATGVLLVGLGRVTRLLRFLTSLTKSYVGEVVLGIETSSLDASGEVIATYDMTEIGVTAVRAAAHSFVGEIDQVPPMVSAVQVGGRRLHTLARAGVEIERPPRRVTIYRFDVDAVPGVDGDPGLPFPSGVFRIEVDCSSGTYVRALAADVGRALGGGAYLRSLRRTAVGSFTAVEACPLDDIGGHRVLEPAEALRDYPRVTIAPEAATAISHGRPLDLSTDGLDGEGPWALLDAAGALLAVYEPTDDGTRARAAVVLVPAGA